MKLILTLDVPDDTNGDLIADLLYSFRQQLDENEHFDHISISQSVTVKVGD